MRPSSIADGPFKMPTHKKTRPARSSSAPSFHAPFVSPSASSLRLTVELVPRSAWWRNLRDALTESRWKRLRQQVLTEQDWRCSICGARGIEADPFEGVQLVCDEVWRYDDDKRIATLVGLQATCRMCSFVKHFGHAQILAAQGSISIQQVVAHFCRVNDCREEAFEMHRAQAFAVWRRRSGGPSWSIDFGEYSAIVAGGEEARRLRNERRGEA